MHPGSYPGERLGLPEIGPSSAASMGQKAGAFLLDALIAGLVTWVFTAPDLPQNWSLISFFVIYTLGTAFVGRTPGMAICRLRLAYDQPDRLIPLWKAAIRTVLCGLVVPAIIVDGDRRGLHDKLAGTTVVNA